MLTVKTLNQVTSDKLEKILIEADADTLWNLLKWAQKTEISVSFYPSKDAAIENLLEAEAKLYVEKLRLDLLDHINKALQVHFFTERRQHESIIEKQQERLNGNENNGAAITSIS